MEEVLKDSYEARVDEEAMDTNPNPSKKPKMDEEAIEEGPAKKPEDLKTGTVVSFSDKEGDFGYRVGFIDPGDGSYHIIFSQSDILCDVVEKGVVKIGDKVEYVLSQNTRIAEFVSLPDGKPAPPDPRTKVPDVPRPPSRRETGTGTVLTFSEKKGGYIVPDSPTESSFWFDQCVIQCDVIGTGVVKPGDKVEYILDKDGQSPVIVTLPDGKSAPASTRSKCQNCGDGRRRQ